MPVSIRPMCPTEEQAISDFRSDCRMQMSLVATAPVIEMLIRSLAEELTMFWNSIDMRAKPYPPNLSKMAASTIDPAIGASTCALGSHRCVENIGSFTRNPIKVISQNIELMEKK